jgi:hypothetical protein
LFSRLQTILESEESKKIERCHCLFNGMLSRRSQFAILDWEWSVKDEEKKGLDKQVGKKKKMLS